MRRDPPLEYLKARLVHDREFWRTFSFLHLRLAYEDRIGQSVSDRDRPPGIWGKSYVRTYYAWVGKSPEMSTRYEGGIASSYFVFRALSEAHLSAGIPLDPVVMHELGEFLTRRTTDAGEIGVYAADHRGDARVLTNLRHTCLGFLLAYVALQDRADRRVFERTCALAAPRICGERSWKDLLHDFFSESWPVGGMAAYIAARDVAFPYLRGTDQRVAATAWPDVRVEMIRALADVDSSTIEAMRGSGQQSQSEGLTEHYPFWHPIKGIPTLRLHSTLGCLHLVGVDIAKLSAGRQRIDRIVRVLMAEMMDLADRAPRFAPSHPPSISAALAILDVITGEWLKDWFEPPAGFEEFIDSVLSFIRGAWSDPAAYKDYWSEFTLPVVASRVLPVVQTQCREDEAMGTGLAGIKTRLFGAHEHEDHAENAWSAVAQTALAGAA